jgi:hypothetical protein
MMMPRRRSTIASILRQPQPALCILPASSLPHAENLRPCTGILREPELQEEAMSWLDIYLLVLFVALIVLLVVKFRS